MYGVCLQVWFTINKQNNVEELVALIFQTWKAFMISSQIIPRTVTHRKTSQHRNVVWISKKQTMVLTSKITGIKSNNNYLYLVTTQLDNTVYTDNIHVITTCMKNESTKLNLSGHTRTCGFGFNINCKKPK